MKLSLVAVGRLKAGPERALVERYGERAGALARSVGFGAFETIELPESKARREDERKREEGSLLLSRLGEGAAVVFDERGASLGSAEFAGKLGAFRDAGTSALGFVVGGPDGLDETVRRRGDLILSFGALTLPHQLVRVLVVEQIYRAMTILSGHPYHRR